MNRTFARVGAVAAIAFCLSIVASDAAPDLAGSIPQIPLAGQSMPFDNGRASLSGFAAALDGATAGKTLRELVAEDEVGTRGAAEAAIYQRASPAVVLVFTKDGFGSGSVISADGLIVTSLHVVAGYNKVGVIFKPLTEGADIRNAAVLVANVVKIDQVRDLALLKLVMKSVRLPKPIQLGDFGKVSVGDDVNAIGHPTGEMWTYTKGYVSQIRRNYSWKADDAIEHTADVIQTQTPINPGNSGGPLLDASGLLIGINAFKADGEGLNFAVGVDEIAAFITSSSDGPTAAQAACIPHVIFEGRTKDDTASIRQVDTECHGKVDAALVVPDDKSKPIYMLVDTNETGTPNGMIVSIHRDGKWNISYWDSTGSGKWDTVGYHPDGKLIPTSYGPYVGK